MRAVVDPRFEAVVRSAPGPEWISAENLVASSGTAALDVMVAAQREAYRAPSDAIAASLLVLEYGRLLSWPVLAAALQHSTRLDPAPGNVVLRPGPLRPGDLAFRAGPVPVPRTADERLARAVDDLVDGHLVGLVDAVHRHTRVGRRTLWSNVAAALGGALLALSWSTSSRHGHVRRARAVLDGHPRLRRLTTPRTVRHDGADWMVCWRRGCCLAFRCDSHGYCGTCPVLDEPERLSRFHRAATRYAQLTAGTPRPPSAGRSPAGWSGSG